MPILAVAGGTSPSLGRAIITALLSSTRSADWNAIILSRSTKVPLWLRAVDQDGTRTQVREVDYLSVESLATALEGVHTVVSVTSAYDGTQAQIQTKLLHASVQAGCNRFAPAQWGFGTKSWEHIGFIKEEGELVWNECVKSKSNIESAKFNIGSFMNYIGLGIYTASATRIENDTMLQQLRAGGGYAAGEDEAIQGLQRQGDLKDGSGAFLVSMKNAIAELPIKEDGQWPRISMISMRDVGRFVVASLHLPKWEEDMTMVGDTLTVHELLAHAEAVTGKTFQVDVAKKSDQQRRLGEVAQEDFMARAWIEFKLAYIRDLDDEVIPRPVVNRLCPEVRPISVREYMEAHWTTT
ncbi:hypothetical protein T440DRAFT_472591 [Plenodomus tracheiphilus IPT5]|uniref:NmrA-like domain-containing protein n=1 Tax=Plenodomus tracheiphilus IPT5 TaxID=1408161 RepID=A0A6A7AQ53_9PLEO|nr:hypothetical protein T440DRAFT_472591 [Plenodomus tracheiphilus IPT5]